MIMAYVSRKLSPVGSVEATAAMVFSGYCPRELKRPSLNLRAAYLQGKGATSARRDHDEQTE